VGVPNPLSPPPLVSAARRERRRENTWRTEWQQTTRRERVWIAPRVYRRGRK